jgi:hypothetical protein
MSEKTSARGSLRAARKPGTAARPAARTIAAACLAATLASACGTTWTRVDGSSVNEAKLGQALAKCRVERKLEGLARAEEERKRELAQARSNQQKMLAKEDYAAIEREVYREIDICMHGQGFRRRG